MGIDPLGADRTRRCRPGSSALRLFDEMPPFELDSVTQVASLDDKGGRPEVRAGLAC